MYKSRLESVASEAFILIQHSETIENVYGTILLVFALLKFQAIS